MKIKNIEFRVDVGTFLSNYFKSFEEARERAIEKGISEITMCIEFENALNNTTKTIEIA